MHTLSTAYRAVESATTHAASISLELATPVLDNANPFDERHPPLMAVSEAWLLASALPQLYAKPQSITCTATAGGTAEAGTAQTSAPSTGATITVQQQSSVRQPTASSPTSNGLASQAFLAKMLSVVPSHWTLLYDSRQHGVGSNRFLHHVLGYKGPTLCMLCGDNEQVFCIASPSEWRETHLYTGDKDCCLIQVLPK